MRLALCLLCYFTTFHTNDAECFLFNISVLWNGLNLRSKLKKTIRETPISSPGWIPTIMINFTRFALDSLNKWLNIVEYWLVFMLHCGRTLVRTLTLRSTILILWPFVFHSGRYANVPHSGPQPLTGTSFGLRSS